MGVGDQRFGKGQEAHEEDSIPRPPWACLERYEVCTGHFPSELV